MNQLVIVLVVIIGVLIGLSAFFSAAETAFTSLNKIRMKNYAKEGNKRAERVLKLMENFDKLLTTVLIGNNIVNIAAATLSTTVFTSILIGFDDWIIPATSTIVMTLLLLTFGEITPKCIAKDHAEKIAMAVSSPISLLMTIFTPLSFMFVKMRGAMSKSMKDDDNPTITEEELIVMIDEIGEEGTIEQHEAKLIKSAIEFEDTIVKEVLTPRVDVTAIDLKADRGDIREIFSSTGFSRIPVYSGTVDEIVGVINSKDFYNKCFTTRDMRIDDIIRPVKFVPVTMKASQLLAELQKSKMHMAVVLDPYGGTVGIVTLEDLLEELVGEIWDESDEVEQAFTVDSDGNFHVSGNANICDIMEEIELRFDREEYEGHTVSGFIGYKLGKIPVNGDKVELDGATIIIKTVKSRRIKDAMIVPRRTNLSEE